MTDIEVLRAVLAEYPSALAALDALVKERDEAREALLVLGGKMQERKGTDSQKLRDAYALLDSLAPSATGDSDE